MTLGDVQDGPEPCDELPPLSDVERAVLDEPLGRPLQTFSVESLFAELEMRFSRFVFYGEEPANDSACRAYRWCKGSTVERLGLTHCLMNAIERDLD